MKLVRIALALAVIAPGLAGAQEPLFRAYLSSKGNDANPCTLAQPCRLLPRALTVVATGGEVWMLDSANYNSGTVTIDRSVSLVAVPGAVGSLVANGADALSIVGTNPSVSLKNLVFAQIAGAPSVGSGVVATGPMTLSVEDCTFAGLPSVGIDVNQGTKLRVRHSTIRDSGGNGITVQGGSSASIDQSHVDGNANGVVVNAASAFVTGSTVAGNGNGVVAVAIGFQLSAFVVVEASTISGNGGAGILGQTFNGGHVVVKAVGNLIVGSVGSAIAASSATVRALASRNTIADNNRAFDNAGGLFETTSDNVVRDNLNANAGTITPITLQ